MSNYVSCPKFKVGTQYYLVHNIISQLSYKELQRLRNNVTELWDKVIERILKERYYTVERFNWSFRKLNEETGLKERHPWYDLCGNKLLNFHARRGLIKSLYRWLTSEMTNKPQLTIFFATGATYLKYLSAKEYDFIAYDELRTFGNLFQLVNSRQLIGLTSLKVIEPIEITDYTGLESMIVESETPAKEIKEEEKVEEEESGCDFSLLNIPLPPSDSGIKIIPFTFTETDILETPVVVRSPPPDFDPIIAFFKALIGVDPAQETILGMVVFNIGDLAHMIRQVVQEYGPFPLIGCDSEGLAWSFNGRPDINLGKRDDYKTCTSGFIITGDGRNVVKTASVVLDMSVTTEAQIRQTLQPVKDKGLTGRGSFAVLLSSCVRGYDGEDINGDVIQRKNNIHSLEMETVRKCCPGTQVIGVQVEDIFGVNCVDFKPNMTRQKYDQSLRDALGLTTPDIVSDDSSSILFIMKYTT